MVTSASATGAKFDCPDPGNESKGQSHDAPRDVTVENRLPAWKLHTAYGVRENNKIE